MKQALILHGTNSTSQDNWFPWLKHQLEEHQWKVWVPDLPHPEKPSIKRYNEFLFQNEDWKFTPETSIVGHSSGAVAVLGVLQALPKGVMVDTCILVGAFEGDLGRKDLKELQQEPFDYDLLRTKARQIIFIHADNDPHCPFLGAKRLCDKLECTLIWVKGAEHFSIKAGGDRFREFPLVLEVLEGGEIMK